MPSNHMTTVPVGGRVTDAVNEVVTELMKRVIRIDDSHRQRKKFWGGKDDEMEQHTKRLMEWRKVAIDAVHALRTAFPEWCLTSETKRLAEMAKKAKHNRELRAKAKEQARALDKC